MKNTIKVRTLLKQAIDTFKEYIKTKGNLQTDYPLEIYMEEILDYIDYLENKNKQLKEQLQNISNEFLKYNWKEATQEQIYNQLKSLYESLFKGSDSNE